MIIDTLVFWLSVNVVLAAFWGMAVMPEVEGYVAVCVEGEEVVNAGPCFGNVGCPAYEVKLAGC